MNNLQEIAASSGGPGAPSPALFDGNQFGLQLDNPFWYAVYTKGRHEKFVSRQLAEREINHFLPMYNSIRRWKDRWKEIDLPLFPGYVFVHVTGHERLRVLQTPGVVRFVSFSGHPAALQNSDVESLKNAMSLGIKAEPHPYLKIGQKVRMKHGPLAGATGILVRKKDKFRLVISLDLIMRSVVAEVQAADIDN